MNGALFLLTVNFLIAQLFCVFFVIISRRSPVPSAGRWFAGAFFVASLAAVFEVTIRYGGIDRFASFGAFSSLLVALLMIRIGLGKLYNVPTDVISITVFLALSLAVNLSIYDLPRGGLWHSLGYQLPFSIAELIAAGTVYRSGRRAAPDLTLMALLIVTAVHFASKIYFAVAFAGGSDAQSYLSSTYALVSQSLGAVLVVSTGLTLLAVIVVEIMDEAKANAEVDPLSGLFNRRAFHEKIGQILKRPVSAYPHCMLLCDLDHFKAVNDTYGHAAGDQVIQFFARMIAVNSPSGAICSRLGGEEFAIFLPSTDETTGYLFAQGLRNNFSSLSFPALPDSVRLTASFGVAVMTASSQTIADAIGRADGALYDAKKSGRNRVSRDARPNVTNFDQWQSQA
ncbi:GGDEF domain-containing protein [Pararhizobium gei]|uniref:GGDEF domain-containing protein n=1 Tax=Pararhizobium gei TaxID=1395951 RepID=UPI0023DC0BC4|nr:GGDEF domain-containing protein [Rhizobium gei]